MNLTAVLTEDDPDIQRGLRLGAAGYMTKPFDALSLRQQVKDIVAAKTPSPSGSGSTARWECWLFWIYSAA